VFHTLMLSKKGISNNLVIFVLILVIFFSLASLGIYFHGATNENGSPISLSSNAQGTATLEILQDPAFTGEPAGDVDGDS
jgi:hypothetical protein